MKNKLLLLLFCLSLFTCEKDDICEEGAAVIPKLIVTFYDTNNPNEKKEVSDMLVFGVDDANEVVIFSGSSITTTDSIAFPLRTDSNVSKIVFHKDYAVDDNDTPDDTSDDFLLGNQDVIDFSYVRESVYISRACGYITNYIELNSNIEADTNNWIIDSEIIIPTIENETEAHVKIYH